VTPSKSTAIELDFSIIVPVYNEEEILESTVKAMVRDFDSRSLDFELILVENGSTDESRAITEALSASDPRIIGIHLPTPNLGGALQTGLLAAKGKSMGHFSVDCVDFEFFDGAVQALKSADLVLGSKRITSNQDHRMFHRRIGSQVFRQISQKVLGTPSVDSHGIKLMSRIKLQPVLERCSGSSEIFDDELILRASHEGVTMLEIPYRCEEIRPSRIGVLPRIVKTLRQLTGLRITLWKERFGK